MQVTYTHNLLRPGNSLVALHHVGTGGAAAVRPDARIGHEHSSSLCVVIKLRPIKCRIANQYKAWGELVFHDRTSPISFASYHVGIAPYLWQGGRRRRFLEAMPRRRYGR